MAMQLEDLKNRKKRNGSTFAKKPSLIKGTKLVHCSECREWIFTNPDSRFDQTKVCTPCEKGWR